MEEIIQELLEKAKQNGSQASVILTEIQELLNGENPQIQDLLERAKQNGTQASVVLLEIEEILYGEEENLEEAKQNGSQSTTILIDLAENHSIQQKYTIALIVDPSGAGTVTGDGTYSEGEEVTLVATPSEGYSFKGWYNGETLVSDNASYTLTVTEDVNLVAKFEILRYSGRAISSSPSLPIAVTSSQSVIIDTNDEGPSIGAPDIIGKVIVSGEYEGEYNLTVSNGGSIVQGDVFIGPGIHVTFEGLHSKGNRITISSNIEKEFVIESISLEW